MACWKIHAELAHWEQGHIDHTDVNFDHFNSELSPKILSNLIQLTAEHKLSHNLKILA